MAHAVHSKMFSQYKNTKECILSNETTNTYMSVLDQLLYASLVQIVDCSEFMQQPVGAMIAWYTIHTKRKISIVEKPEAITNLIQFLLNDDPTAKMVAYKRAQIERNVTRSVMEHFAKFVRHYRKLALDVFTGKDRTQQGLTHMHGLSRQLRMTNSHCAFGLAQVLDYWMELESRFRGMILEKYIRLVLNTANRDYKGYRYVIEVDEFIQNYAAAALKAIDKSSVGDMGTLTIYIQSWLKNALLGTVTNFNYSIPFSVPPNKLSEHATEAVDLDSPAMQGLAAEESGDEEELEVLDTITRVRLLAKAVDPTGVGRILLGIDEHLTASEIARINPQACAA